MAAANEKTSWIIATVLATGMHGGVLYAYADKLGTKITNKTETEISIISLPSVTGSTPSVAKKAKKLAARKISKPASSIKPEKVKNSVTKYSAARKAGAPDKAQSLAPTNLAALQNEENSTPVQQVQDKNALENLDTSSKANLVEEVQSPKLVDEAKSVSRVDEAQNFAPVNDATSARTINDARASKPISDSRTAPALSDQSIVKSSDIETARPVESAIEPVIAEPANQPKQQMKITRTAKSAETVETATTITSSSPQVIVKRVETVIEKPSTVNQIKTAAQKPDVKALKSAKVEPATTTTTFSRSTIQNRSKRLKTAIGKPAIVRQRSVSVRQSGVGAPKRLSTSIKRTKAAAKITTSAFRSSNVGKSVSSTRNVARATSTARVSPVQRSTTSRPGVTPVAASKAVRRANVVTKTTSRKISQIKSVLSDKPKIPEKAVEKPAPSGDRIALLSRPTQTTSRIQQNPAAIARENYNKIITFLRFNESKSNCFLALPEISGEDTLQLAGYSNKSGSWSEFQRQLEQKIRAKVPGQLNMISDAQCDVVTFARQNGLYPSFSLSIFLEQPLVNSGDFVIGKIFNTGERFLKFFLVDDEGLAINIDKLVKPATNYSKFEIQVNLTDNAVKTSQLLLAIASDQPLDTARFKRHVRVKNLLKNIAGEVSAKNLKLDLALSAFIVR